MRKLLIILLSALVVNAHAETRLNCGMTVQCEKMKCTMQGGTPEYFKLNNGTMHDDKHVYNLRYVWIQSLEGTCQYIYKEGIKEKIMIFKTLARMQVEPIITAPREWLLNGPKKYCDPKIYPCEMKTK